MDYKEKLQYLYGYIDFEKKIRIKLYEIEQIKNEISELKTRKASVSYVLDGMPKSSRQTDMSSYIVALEDHERKLRRAYAVLCTLQVDRFKIRESISNVIESLNAGIQTEKYKLILRYRFLNPVNGEAMEYKKIAKITGINSTTLKHQVHEAIELLEID